MARNNTITFITAIVLAAGLAACGNAEADPENSTAPMSEEEMKTPQEDSDDYRVTWNRLDYTIKNSPDAKEYLCDYYAVTPADEFMQMLIDDPMTEDHYEPQAVVDYLEENC